MAEKENHSTNIETVHINEDYVIKRIEELCEQKHWSKYRLAKKSGIPHSTIFNMLKRTNTPTIGTLVKICNGLGITLSQFFADDEYVTLTKQQKLLLRLWGTLENEEKIRCEAYIKGVAGDRGKGIELSESEEDE
ncbi:MAG TPA: helix-turn-helix transcriptional regulator [Candidatus Fimimorpha faecalis]|uniref:Helix-turn-helix transcriptional regulator n=1 Tax=Candidatus Fimimorpha faecalis TaxID=2840824 RepID=A0A9D1EEE9_9FIRM|nr:helix-turn-helix transcriptional regulator [Candidatus Fimimorpha faecalis]